MAETSKNLPKGQNFAKSGLTDECGIRIQTFRVEAEHADLVTTTPAKYLINIFVSFCSAKSLLVSRASVQLRPECDLRLRRQSAAGSVQRRHGVELLRARRTERGLVQWTSVRYR